MQFKYYLRVRPGSSSFGYSLIGLRLKIIRVYASLRDQAIFKKILSQTYDKILVKITLRVLRHSLILSLNSYDVTQLIEKFYDYLNLNLYERLIFFNITKMLTYDVIQ